MRFPLPAAPHCPLENKHILPYSSGYIYLYKTGWHLTQCKILQEKEIQKRMVCLRQCTKNTRWGRHPCVILSASPWLFFLSRSSGSRPFQPHVFSVELYCSVFSFDLHSVFLANSWNHVLQLQLLRMAFPFTQDVFCCGRISTGGRFLHFRDLFSPHLHMTWVPMVKYVT